jgi:hypothetical protein
VVPFPDEKTALAEKDAPILLDAVEALHTDKDGIIWLLDNGRRSEMPPKVLAWNDDDGVLKSQHVLVAPATVAGSYLADLVVDSESPLVILSDPANGPNAGLILLNRQSGVARRVLEGHSSMVPDPSAALKIPKGLTPPRRLDGSSPLPHSGVGALALDRKKEWLYYAPVQSRRLFRLPMRVLRKPGTSNEALAAAVETYCDKPPCSSFVIDSKNNIHLGDIESRAIGVIEASNRSYRVLASDARLLWPHGLCFGQDGKLYFFSRAAPSVALSGPTSPLSAGQHSVFRTKPLAEGRAGD